MENFDPFFFKSTIRGFIFEEKICEREKRSVTWKILKAWTRFEENICEGRS